MSAVECVAFTKLPETTVIVHHFTTENNKTTQSWPVGYEWMKKYKSLFGWNAEFFVSKVLF